VIDRDAAGLFRRHVLNRADDGAAGRHARTGHARGRARDPEVHDQRVAFGLDHDVGRFQIAMDDARLVRRAEARRDLAHDADRPLDRHSPFFFEQRREVGPLDVRHRDVRDAVDLTEIVDADDVLVRDLAGEKQLAFEPPLERLRRVLVLGVRRPNHFHRDGDLEHLVPGLIDRAHATDAEQPDDVVSRSEIVADGQRSTAPGRVRDGAARPRRRVRGYGADAPSACRPL
jgi:hypothetical protein